jgi:hypothetical protein
MNKEQQELLDEVYKKYQSQTMFRTDDLVSLEELDGMCLGTGEIKKVYRQYAPKEFINKCKTDTEFSERWGLKIEERELSLEERSIIAKSNHYEVSQNIKMFVRVDEDRTLHKNLDEINIPTKLITVTYNDIKIESHE